MKYEHIGCQNNLMVFNLTKGYPKIYISVTRKQVINYH